MKITPDTWIISDTHFGHANIIKYCNRPVEHNRIMARNWREVIHESDTVLHLGDLAVWYGDTRPFWLKFAKNLPGQKFMLKGNHDKGTDEFFAEYGYTIVPEFIQEFKGQRVLFSHHPDEDRLGQWDINIHGHIHNNPLDERYGASINRRYKNVSIEVMDYKPVKLREIITT